MSENSGLSKWILSSLNLERFELKKFIPLSLIMFCVLFNYTILRDIKDVLINTAPGAGPEVIPYIKGIFVVFAAVLFVFCYSKLACIIDPKKLFPYVVSFFVAFFVIFGFVLHPLSHILHPSHELVVSLRESFPAMKFFISIWSVWSYALFYVLSELWGSAMLSLLFWQFANEIVLSSEAKRFYPLFGIVSNLALILSGRVIIIFADVDFAAVDPWGETLRSLSITIGVVGLLMILIQRWMMKNVLTDPKLCPMEKKDKKAKVKIGFLDSMKCIFQSKYLGLIAILVFSYGMSINIIELVWKKQLAMRFMDNQNGYAAFMGGVSQYTGIFVVLFILFTKGIINKLGWFVGAVITPIVMFVTGLIFVMFVLFSGSDFINDVLMSFGISSIVAASFVGGMQNIMAKGCKYSLFDPTKEMAYIPLDSTLKTQGKAAVDVVGGRLGKAGGSYLWMILFFVIPNATIMTCAPFAIGLLGFVILAWICSVSKLSKMYGAKLKEQENV